MQQHRTFMSEVSRLNILIWALLAFQAGVLNIGGFLACHRFVSHVTGFATFFGYEVSEGRFNQATVIILVPLLFLVGSMVSGELVDVRIRKRLQPLYHFSFGIIWMLILFVLIGGLSGFFGSFGSPAEDWHDYLLLGVLCLVCGIQNGTVTTVSRSIVRTTHLTGITTDLGIGIMRLLHGIGTESRRSEEIMANYMRIAIILGFILGSGLGGLLFDATAFWGFLLPAVTSGGIFILTFVYRKHLSAIHVGNT